MAPGPTPETAEAIRNPPSLEDQISTLSKLKNDIIGHIQRKELTVQYGVVEPLVDILASSGKAAGKKKSAANGVAAAREQAWTREDDVRLQATQILASLAGGGAAFVKPLLAAGIWKQLIEVLDVERTPLATDSNRPAEKLVTATLQAIRSLSASASLVNEVFPEKKDLPMEALDALLKQPTTTSVAKQHLKLVLEIIALSATDDATRTTLANSGLLDTLSALLGSYAIANKHIDYRGPNLSQFPPSPPNTAVSGILSAIIAIITGSTFRAQCFILSPSIKYLFFSNNPSENLLPPLHIPTYKSVSFNGSASNAFPALASLQGATERKSNSSFDTNQHGDADHANAVVAWLIFLARSMGGGVNRLIALKLLALVNSAIDADSIFVPPRSESLQRARERERQLSMLAIPLAVQLVQVVSEGKFIDSTALTATTEEKESQEVKEQACSVLALLIQSSKELQTAAVDAGAIKRVCPILKKSFDNVTIARPMWYAQKHPEAGAETPDSCRTGNRGLPSEIRHVMRTRQSALEGLAALAKKEDAHRKAIVEAGVVSCIIDSLKPLSPAFAGVNQTSNPPQRFTGEDGNTTSVILAACHAAQSMSRSVSLLRTSLIDAGIAKPVFELLKHPDSEVQIAATDVCCNLLLEFSPMRDDLLAAGAIKTLSEHARQSEMGLRLASLWALKHLVLASSRDVKEKCLEELTSGWLVGAIQGESKETPTGGVSISAGGLNTQNAAGEQVTLLNPQATSMDVDDPESEDDEEPENADDDGEMMYDEASSTHYQSSQLRSTLRPPPGHPLGPSTGSGFGFNRQRFLHNVREREQDPALQAKRDDVAVQEQALDFVRNMLNGDDCAHMFDYLLKQIGQDKVFALLADKLAPVSASSSKGKGTIYQQTELILSTIHVLTHIANSSPTHKQLLIAQSALLKNWLPHFSHPDRRVRVICVWAVNSLTWVEDDADREAALGRMRVLRDVGIESAVKGLKEDSDLDVRERVRTAIRQMEGL